MILGSWNFRLVPVHDAGARVSAPFSLFGRGAPPNFLTVRGLSEVKIYCLRQKNFDLKLASFSSRVAQQTSCHLCAQARRKFAFFLALKTLVPRSLWPKVTTPPPPPTTRNCIDPLARDGYGHARANYGKIRNRVASVFITVKVVTVELTWVRC